LWTWVLKVFQIRLKKEFHRRCLSRQPKRQVAINGKVFTWQLTWASKQHQPQSWMVLQELQNGGRMGDKLEILINAKTAKACKLVPGTRIELVQS
jgi:hypothetical protein